ncbi:four helix bundle protein [Halalkalibaculum sp. DA3122]|uniref:four helix bundle protein n=1 Tax=unclassified Halalkalibaculum TaxID=2964617 RepID=UPI0037544454
MNRFKNLDIWKRAVELASQIYEVTVEFPDEEKYGLVSQLRRCAVSIGSNIAEGAGRGSNSQFKHFLSIAYGSSYELETQLIIAENLNFIDESENKDLLDEVTTLQKMIYSLSQKLE